MAKNKVLKVPGSIIKKPGTNKLYLKIHGKVISTSIDDDKDGFGRQLCHNMLEKMFLDSLRNDGFLPDNKPGNQKKVYYLFPIFEEFINECKELGLSKNTIRNYRYAKSVMFPEDMILTEENVKDAVRKVMKKKVENSTINTYLRNMNVFVNYCVERKILNSRLQLLKNNKKAEQEKEVPTFESEDWEKILSITLQIIEENKKKVPVAANEKRRGTIDREYYLYLDFMYQTGSRSAEALRVKWSDIDLENEVVKFPNKENKKIQLVPMTDRLKEILEELKVISEKRQGEDKKAKLFYWEDSSTSVLSRAFAIIERRAGTKLKYNSLHKIRKTFATELIENGATIYEVQDLVRHADIRTTLKFYKGKKIKKLQKLLNETKQKSK